MSKYLVNNFIARKILLVFFVFISNIILSDSFVYNSYNNHGVVGLINTPSARFFNESVHGVTIYDGSPDQKITLTSNPFDWMEASFFYTNIQGKPYCSQQYDPVCRQDYKDKGFNVKLRLKEEGILPAIAIGLNDFAGTGYYSSEYLVGSYGFSNIDIHFGLGWGTLDGSSESLKNPLGYLSDNFFNRPIEFADRGGQFQPSRYFSGKTASPFYGFSYILNDKTIIKAERDTTLTSGKMPYEIKEHEYSFSFEYMINDNFSVGIAHERGNYLSFKFLYKNNPKNAQKSYEYKTAESNQNDSKYDKLIRNLEQNGIGVQKISETSRSIGLELTQFIHPNLNLVEEIIKEASRDAGIEKNIKKNIKIADLNAINEIDNAFQRSAKTIYERASSSSVNNSTRLKFRPFIASREEFFKGAILIENDTEFILKKNLFFNVNLKYSLANNFSDLKYPPVDTFPAQVRSDVKQYLKRMDKGILLGRAQLDFHLTPKKNHHLMFSGGVFEDMFSGAGFEYLNFKENNNYSFGFEMFKVYKRDYEWRLGHLDYENIIYSANFYYRNYGLIPFDMKISAGEYLAGDKGSTIEFSRSYKSGVRFGVFASLTDVSTADFGEGSFDKGIFFNIPIYGNLINYTWRPLTKDPGAKLIRKNSLYDLLVKLRPIE